MGKFGVYFVYQCYAKVITASKITILSWELDAQRPYFPWL